MKKVLCMLDFVKRKSKYDIQMPVNQLLTGGGLICERSHKVTTLDLRLFSANDKFSLICFIDYGMTDRNIGVFHGLFGGECYGKE